MSARARQLPIAEGRMTLREVRVSLLQVADLPVESQRDSANPDFIAAALRVQFQADTDPQENLFAFYFDSRDNLLASERVYRGSVAEAMCATRDIARSALMLNAVGVVVAHNHPSGDPAPSSEDIAYTRRLSDALRSLDITLMDHVILAGRRNRSLRAMGVL